MIEDFALDLAGFEHVLRKRLKHGLAAQREAERFHAADQPPLAMANGSQPFSEGNLVPSEFGPFWKLMDVSGHSPHLLRRL